MSLTTATAPAPEIEGAQPHPGSTTAAGKAPLPDWVRRNVRAFLAVDGMLAAATALPHAILTPLLLAKGLGLADIAMLQAAYSAVVLLVEYPSGVLADVVSRKQLFLASKLVLIGFFALAMWGHGLEWMMAAWALYGISSALDSGTIDSDVINALKEHVPDSDREISSLVRRDNQIGLACMLLASTIGSWLYFTIGFSMYYLAMGLVLMTLVTVGRWFREPPVARRTTAQDAAGSTSRVRRAMMLLRGQLTGGFTELATSAELRLFMLLSLATQVFFQCHFQFWQAFFLAKGIDARHLSWLYVIFQLVGIGVSHVSTHAWTLQRLRAVVAGALPVLVVLAVAAAWIPGWWSLAPYTAFVAAFWILVNHTNFAYRKHVSQENISALTSLSSSVSRIGSIVTLLAISALLGHVGVALVIAGSFTTATMLVLLVLLVSVPRASKS